MALPRILLAFLLTLTTATPALAQSSAVPEPSSLLLLGLGAAGVIIGRHGGRRRKD
jgi:hypothetical protein